MDKNKAAFKLKNVPHIYWINLDAEEHRKVYMETQFKYWEIENHTRISGFDGRIDDPSSYLKGIIPDGVNSAELGCCMSHIKAIKYFYENTNDPYCIIAEDDVSFEPTKNWNFTWQEFFSLLPYDWDCVQLTTICTGDIHIKLHLKFVNDFSAAFYLITRHHAAKIIKNHVRGDKYKLDNGVKPRAVSEDTILESGKTYTIPLFLYNLNMGSAIHPEHLGIYHKGPYEALMNYWRQSGVNFNLKEHMNYDPYYQRISNPSSIEEET